MCGACDQLGMEGKAHTTGQQSQLYNPEGEFCGKPLELVCRKCLSGVSCPPAEGLCQHNRTGLVVMGSKTKYSGTSDTEFIH